MKQYLNDIIRRLEFPVEACDELTLAFDKLASNEACYTKILSFIEEYDSHKDIDYLAMLSTAEEVARSIGIHEYTVKLICFLCLTKRLEGYYEEAGIDKSIFLSSILDLKYKLIECKLVKGVWGSFVARWFRGFFLLERFALGRLQFELIRFGRDYKINGVELTPESRVINVHIPRSGERLSPEATANAYAMAAEFYAERLCGAPTVFVCDSWLLFPKNKEIMKEGSNLLLFISDYELYDSGYYEDYHEVWRLFDKDYDGDTSRLPCDSSLRKEYIRLIENGEKIGYGKGAYLYKA